MTVYCLSRAKFRSMMAEKGIDDNNVESYTGTAFIQIQGTKPMYNFYLQKEHPNVLSLEFDDCDTIEQYPLPDTFHYYETIPMTKKQGKLIVEFVRRNRHVKTFIVHCYAGQSRSGGVGQWISEHFGISSQSFLFHNPFVHPNRRIINILNDMAYGKEYANF